MRISDWSSDVCSSDLRWHERALNSGPSPSDEVVEEGDETQSLRNRPLPTLKSSSFSKLMFAEDWEKALALKGRRTVASPPCIVSPGSAREKSVVGAVSGRGEGAPSASAQTVKRSEEHTSELPSLMRISYAVFCLKK